MVNPLTGEVALEIDGVNCVLKLTLGSLAELETQLDTGGLVDLVERFETGAFGTRDVMLLIVAGLRGGGWQGQAADLMAAEISGGPIKAARVAAQLLVRAFHIPETP